MDARIAHDMLRELRGYRLLMGYRTGACADLAAVCRAIAAVSRAALAMPADVTDIEINPLLAQVDGAKALDALVLFAAD